MTSLALTNPSIGQPNSTEDIDIINAFTAIQTWGNGNIDSGNLTGATRDQAGLSDGTTVRRGKSIIVTPESRTNAAYGTLPTPDQVVGIVLPTDAFLVVGFQATWQESVNNAARAAIFIGANQLKLAATVGAAPTVQETSLATSVAAIDKPLTSSTGGLFGVGNDTTAYTGDVTTGQVLGSGGSCGPCYIFAAAGTYTISVQFKSTSGSVTVKNRKLWVWTMGF